LRARAVALGSAVTGVARAVAGLSAGLVDLLLPDVCAGCGCELSGVEGLCDECSRKLLALVSMSYCPRCGASVGPNIPISEEGCFACPNPVGRFARVVRLGPYAEPLRSILRELKYRRRELMVRRLGKMLAHAVETRCGEEDFDLLISVPMHWRRRLGRGCDHARLLGRAVARRLELPMGDELVRTRHTPQQARLPRSRRFQNIRGAFAARAASTLQGARVLLVDDITTTGATASEAARALLKAGASKVTLAVVAKAEPPRAYSNYWKA